MGNTEAFWVGLEGGPRNVVSKCLVLSARLKSGNVAVFPPDILFSSSTETELG